MTGFQRYTLSQTEFMLLKNLVLHVAGIYLSDSKRELLISRFSRRLRHLGYRSFAEYYNFLTSSEGEPEIEHFINTITTNKTGFFREAHHFDFLAKQFVDEVKDAGRPIRMWSSACSTGEEAYTIAMVMHRRLTQPFRIPVSVLGTDIDTKVLMTARKAVYDEHAVADVPEEYLHHAFLKSKDPRLGLYKIKPEIRKMVTFEQFNFIDRQYRFSPGFDVIFCRNVIIYFSSETKTEVIRKLIDMLRLGGYLIVGHSESLFDISDTLEFVTNTVYRRVQ